MRHAIINNYNEKERQENKTHKEQVMHSAVVHQPLTDAQPVTEAIIPLS